MSSYAWSKYGREVWYKTAERWDVRKALSEDLQETEKWLPLYEQSLVDGLRLSEPRVPLKPRALARVAEKPVPRRDRLFQMRRPWPRRSSRASLEEGSPVSAVGVLVLAIRRPGE